VLPDPENMGNAVGISLLSCIRAELKLIPIYFQLMAAIFDLRLTQTMDSIPTPKHLYRRWIVLLSFIQAKIIMCNWIYKAAILNFWLPLSHLLITIISVTPVESPYLKIGGDG